MQKDKVTLLPGHVKIWIQDVCSCGLGYKRKHKGPKQIPLELAYRKSQGFF